MTVFEPKYPFRDPVKTDAIPPSHTPCLNIEGLKSYLKDSLVFLDLGYFLGHLFIEKRIPNTHHIRGEKIQKRQDSSKTKLNLSIFEWNGLCCPFKNHILKKQNTIKEKFTHFPVIKNTFKQIAFENEYNTIIIFSLLYLPTFLPNLRLMRPLSFI